MKPAMSLEKIKEFIDSLEREEINYMVIAGVGLDGKRGFLTRPHQDLDILVQKKDLPSIEKILKKLDYCGEKYNDLYKVLDGNGGKIDIGLISFDKKEAILFGRIAVTRFPKFLFWATQEGCIETTRFKIAPNELLKTWGTHSKKGKDSEYVESLPVDNNQIKKIKRTIRGE